MMFTLIALGFARAEPSRAEPSVQFVGDGHEILALDTAGAERARCTSPCALPLAEGSQRFLTTTGARPLLLDPGSDGKVYRVTGGAPGRRGVGLLLSLVGGSTVTILAALDANPNITVGAAPWLGAAAVSATGLGLTIRSRPRFVEE
jgi:hypothetical protein